MYGEQQVECPRCGKRRSLKLHLIVASDAQECPRCWYKDGVEVPMALYPSGSGRHGALDREPDRQIS
jgi:DNA-directed RNA polymerase subunit RPC12/RpoP